MQECAKHLGLPLVTDDQPVEVLEPGDGTFDFPASAIASEASTVLSFDFLVAAMGADQFDSSTLQPSPQRVAVCSSIVNQPFGILRGRPRPTRGTATCSSVDSINVHSC